MAVGEVDIFLMEDGGPLEGSGCNASDSGIEALLEASLTMLCLARGAMAELAVEGLAAAQLVLHLAAVAVGCVLGLKVVGLLMNGVGGALFPLGDARGRVAAALVLVHSVYCGGEAGELLSCEVRS